MTSPDPRQTPVFSAQQSPWFDPAVLAATCGGLGRIPFAPGTFGAAAGLLVSLALSSLRLPAAVEFSLLLAVNLIGIPICSAAARRLGRGEDPGAIVYDEMASMAIGLAAVPAADRSAVPGALPLLAAAFLLHRFFDILKPFPCRRLEHLPSGLGIMADDWGAAAWMALSLAAARSCGWL
jgi:phosphatidylglycerophosphatase A